MAFKTRSITFYEYMKQVYCPKCEKRNGCKLKLHECEIARLIETCESFIVIDKTKQEANKPAQGEEGK